MPNTLLATLTPMLTLFSCIIIGFVLRKASIIPDEGSKVLSKVLVWVFYPALCFSSMARFFTVQTISIHTTNLLMTTVSLSIAIGIALPLSSLFVKGKVYELGIYRYALVFANSGYMGDPLVQALFGEEVLSYYKLACLPISIAIYTWGVSILVPKDKKSGNVIKKLLNPPIVSMLLGMAVGLICGALVNTAPVDSTAYDTVFPAFIVKTLDSLKSCMGPTAMILAGITVAKYDFPSLFKNKKVYIATALRLIILPSIILGALFGIKELINFVFGVSIDNTPVILLFFALASPLGLNTVVFPEAYGGDPKTGASMALISHTLCVITIPLMFSLLMALFGDNTWLTLII